MKTILFVDDQPEILRGIERSLDDMADEWEMHFAESGLAALDKFQQIPIDILVSDMRMPGMDGAELLSQVSQRYPQTVRIVLSGEADREAVFRAVQPMHQYLAKPCDAVTLTTTVTRACALRELLDDESLNQVVAKISSLPSLPAIYQELMTELDSEDPSIQSVGSIIEKDIAMTAKILQLANSSLFGMRSQITSPSQATSLLGLDNIKNLVLTVGVFSQDQGKTNHVLSIERLMNHSLFVGGLAKQIMQAAGGSRDAMNDALTAGMLHDVGKLVLAGAMTDEYQQILNTANSKDRPEFEIELERLGTTHAAIGAYLLALWGLPQSIVEAVAFHHRPQINAEREFTSVLAVHVANALTHASTPEELEPLLDMEILKQLDLQGQLEIWCKIAHAWEASQ